MSSLLITGGDGFLGRALIRRLLRSHRLVVLEKGAERVARLGALSSEIRIYDYDRTDLAEVFDRNGIEVILHAATYYGRGEGEAVRIIDSNILLPVRLITLGVERGIRAFFNTDSYYSKAPLAYGHLEGYALSKKNAVEWLRQFSAKTKIVNLRLEHMYGRGDGPDKFVVQIIRSFLRDEPEIRLTEGRQKRDFVYVEDVADAFAFLLRKLDALPAGFNHFDVGTGQATSIRDFVTMARRLTGASTATRWGALPYRKNEIMNSQANSARLGAWGWRAETALENGLKKTIRWERKILRESL